MSTEYRIKQSLLLTHGTIYGAIPANIQKDYDDISESIINAWSVPWRTELYPVVLSTQVLIGPMTHNEPIDVIHWNAGPGSIGESGMEWWQQCLTLFMRHI